MRRRQQPALANPVLIGAVTVLVAVVAVFLAYNAIQSRVKEYKVPELEQWRNLAIQGRLTELADSLAQHPESRCPSLAPRYRGTVTLTPH